MSELNFEKLIEEAKTAARNAGLKILEIYNSNDFDVELKGDDSPLTKADRAAHISITEHLGHLGIPILSEEGKHIEYSTRKNWEYFWMVDPLDGTKEFIKRNGEFTVNIALIHEGKSILGVVYVPVTDEIYFAYSGSGAFKQKGIGEVIELKVSEFKRSKAGLRVVASRSHLNGETQQFIDQLETPEIVSMGSSLKFMVIAEGNAEYYPRYAPTMEWDTAAAQAIVDEAGGSVLIKNSEEIVKYNKENLLNPEFLVSAKLSR